MMKKRIIALIIVMAVLFNLYPANIKAEKKDDAIAWVLEQVGKSLDYDNYYGPRSVDLIKWYYAYFGVANYALGDACSYRNNILPPGWERLYGQYQPGDVVVWKIDHSCETCTTSALGHVGIIISIENDGFYAVSQGLKQEGICTLDFFSLESIDCVLRPKYIEGEEPFPEQKPDVYFRDYKILSLEETNAKLEVKVVNLNAKNVTGLGCRLYDKSNNLIKEYVEGCNYRFLNVSYWCDFNADMKYTLTPGTYYKCQLYTIVDGVEYKDEFREFTTKGGDPISEITPTPTVSPTIEPTASPTPTPTVSPTIEPTASPTPEPTVSPTIEPTASPTSLPTVIPTSEPVNPIVPPILNSLNEIPDVRFVKKLKLSSNDNKKIILKWAGTTDVDSYEIYRATKKNGKYKCIAKIKDSNTTKYIDKSVKPLKKYYYKVVAVGKDSAQRLYTAESNKCSMKVTGLVNPKINVKSEKHWNGTNYIVINLKKCDGKYFEIYVKLDKKYKKISLSSNLVKKHSSSFRLRYNGKSKKISIKVRTYNVKNKQKIYSNLSRSVIVNIK